MTHLLIIDPQNDFADPKGSLFVPGADSDCARLAAFVDAEDSVLDAITVTLDTHNSYAIFHPSFWRRKNGASPAPFTIITNEALRSGEFLPVDAAMEDYVLYYTASLEKGKRYQLTIWPPHCLLATWGHCIETTLRAALDRWEKRHAGSAVRYITKGVNPLTEHYSVLRAEVPDPADPADATNRLLLEALNAADKVYVAGEAVSHCVLFTLRDTVKAVDPEKITLLSDCTSAVIGFSRKKCLEVIGDMGVKIR